MLINSPALAGMAALAVAMGIGRFAFTPILPMMQADQGLSIAQGSWLASANYIGYLAGALAAIRVPLAPTVAIRIGLLAISLSTLAMAMRDCPAVWFALRAIAGIASAWVLVFVSAWALERRAKGGTLFAGVGAGIAVAGAACLTVMAAHASAIAAWIALGLMSFAVTALLWRSFEPVGKASVHAHSNARGPRHGLLVICYGICGFGYVVPATFLPAMAKEIIADPMIFGWAWPVFGAAAAGSTVLAGRFADQRCVWSVAALLMALGVVLPLVAPGLAGILAASVLVGGTFMVITMAGMREARRVAGELARPLIAAMTSAFALGQIAGPLWVAYRSNVAQALLAAALVLALSAGTLFFTASPGAES
ncbi:MAG: YbfB/YjiJ family MFS transporter [Betaproteobacteria bacterium]|nr:YbfB/YjiJ family MFS transporter [Betaproteobacteria bacterium]